MGNTPSQALEILQWIYGNNNMSCTHCFEWHKRFKEEVKDDSRSRKPSSSRTEYNSERVKQVVYSDRRSTIRMIPNQLVMKKDRVWLIITEDLGIRKVGVKSFQDWWSEWKLYSDLSGVYRALSNWTKLERVELSHLMRHGFLNKTRKPSARVFVVCSHAYTSTYTCRVHIDAMNKDEGRLL